MVVIAIHLFSSLQWDCKGYSDAVGMTLHNQFDDQMFFQGLTKKDHHDHLKSSGMFAYKWVPLGLSD